MRALLMLLVLANLGFFAWQRWYVDPRGTPSRAQEDPVQRLMLVGEQPGVPAAEENTAADQNSAGQRIEPTEAPAEEGASTVAETCVTLGPFDRQTAAMEARARLRELGLPAVLRESGGQIRSGFWVYLPPHASRDEAKRVEDELKARGVQDLFIVAGSEQRNAISLGLFSTPERADQRAAEIGRLGYSPRVAERFRDAIVYWVDFRERADEPLSPERLGLPASGETLPEKQVIPCGDIAVDDVEA